MTVVIREATAEDFLELCGRTPPVSVRAIVAERDGKIECIAGITLEKGISIAFSEMRSDAPKKLIFKTALRMVEWMRKFHPTVTLDPDQMKSDKFLRKLGFEHKGERSNFNIYRL